MQFDEESVLKQKTFQKVHILSHCGTFKWCFRSFRGILMFDMILGVSQMMFSDFEIQFLQVDVKIFVPM